MTLPEIPALPAGATWDQQMRHLEAQQRAAHVLATLRLADVQEAARLVAVQQVEQAKRMADLLAEPAPVSTPAEDIPHLVALVSSMTSTQRANPAAAATAARQQLAALKG